MLRIFPWMLNVMTVLARTVAALLIALSCASPLVLNAAQPPSPEQQEQFTPISELPPQEQYPVLPLLVGAYVFVVVVLFVYLFSLARRLTAVQREIDRLDADIKRTGRA
jgi:CcmD family protein